MSSSAINKFADYVHKVEVENAYRRFKIGWHPTEVVMSVRYASELLAEIRRLERERDDAVAENMEAKA